MTDHELIQAVRFAVGTGKLTRSFRAPVGGGIWFVLDNGGAFSIERKGDGWDIADVAACL